MAVSTLKLKVRFEPKGDAVLAIPLYANGQPLPFGTPIEGRKKGAFIRTLTARPVEWIIEDLTATRPRGHMGTTTAGQKTSRGTPTTAASRAGSGNGKTITRAAARKAVVAAETAKRPRGRPRKTVG